MKKLLVLMLVLGMASLASAGLQISLGGVLEPIDSEITLFPSDTIELDIWTDAILGGMESFDWALVVDYNKGSISGGADAGASIDLINEIGGAAPDPDNGVLPDDPLAGIWGFMANLGGDIPAGTVLLDQIVFHCEAPGDAYVQLWATVSGQPFGPTSGGVMMDQVIIHQDTPEPMTLALLGLGGLFLRRRK